MAIEYTSDAKTEPIPSFTSGAMKFVVPAIVDFKPAELICSLARPKSQIFKCSP